MEAGTAKSIKIICPYCQVERTMILEDDESLYCEVCDGWYFPGDWTTEERQRIYKEVGI